MNEVLLEADRLEKQGNPLGRVLRFARAIKTHYQFTDGYGDGGGYGVGYGNGYGNGYGYGYSNSKGNGGGDGIENGNGNGNGNGHAYHAYHNGKQSLGEDRLLV